MPKRAQYYAWFVVASGCGIAATALLLWPQTGCAPFLACLALAALAATFKLRLPGVTGTISPAFVFLLVAAGQLSWSETVGIGIISGLIQSLWRAKVRPSTLQVLFNASVVGISAALADSVSRYFATSSPALGAIPVLLVAGMVLLISNTMLVSIILCLLKEAPLSKVWESLQAWAVPYYLAGGLLASVFAQVRFTLNPWAVLFAATGVYLLSVASRGILRWRTASIN